MKTILVINDNSPEGLHAAKFALNIAHKMQAAVLLANVIPVEQYAQQVLAAESAENAAEHANERLEQLTGISQAFNGFKPEISELDISGMDADELAQMINKNDVLMVAKGTPDNLPVFKNKLNVHTVLNKVRCPLLLIPEKWRIKNIERIVYVADMRYCRTQIVNLLAEMARACDASLSVAHLSAKGIPDLEENYANSIFKKEVYDRLSYKSVFFNNIREKDLEKAIDVIINGMHNELLALINHRFHFEEIFGRYLTDVLPPNITIPVLIFPY